MRNDDDVDPRLHQEAGDNVFLKLPLGWIGALALRNDDGNTANHRNIPLAYAWTDSLRTSSRNNFVAPLALTQKFSPVPSPSPNEQRLCFNQSWWRMMSV